MGRTKHNVTAVIEITKTTGNNIII